MTIFYIKMKIRAGGGAVGHEGGILGQQGAPPAIPLYGKHYVGWYVFVVHVGWTVLVVRVSLSVLVVHVGWSVLVVHVGCSVLVVHVDCLCLWYM